MSEILRLIPADVYFRTILFPIEWANISNKYLFIPRTEPIDI